jgi:uncharacterized protein (DUF1778 family)
MAKVVTLRLTDTEYQLYARAAKAVRRSVSNLIKHLAQQQLEEDIFADQIEMDEILGSPELVNALRQGSQDAAQRKGAFVDV